MRAVDDSNWFSRLRYAVIRLLFLSLWIFAYISSSLLLLDVIFYRIGFPYDLANLFTFSYWSVPYYPIIFNDCKDIDDDCYIYSTLFVLIIYQFGIVSSIIAKHSKYLEAIKTAWYWIIAFGLLGFGILRFAYDVIAHETLGYNNSYYGQCFWIGSAFGAFLIGSSFWLELRVFRSKKAMAAMTIALVLLTFTFTHIDEIASPFSIESAYLQLLILVLIWQLIPIQMNCQDKRETMKARRA